MSKLILLLAVTVAGAMALLLGIAMLPDILSGQGVRLAGYASVLTTMLWNLVLIVGGLSLFLWVMQRIHGPYVTRRRPDPRLVPGAAVYDITDLLIVGRLGTGDLLIQNGWRRSEVPPAAVRAVVLRSLTFRYELLGFELHDPKAPVIWRHLPPWDSAGRRRNEAAALLGLP